MLLKRYNGHTGKNLERDQQVFVFFSLFFSLPHYSVFPPFLPLCETGSQLTGGLLDEEEDTLKLLKTRDVLVETAVDW